MTDGSSLPGVLAAERFTCSGHAQTWLYRTKAELHDAYNAVNGAVGIPLTAEETEATSIVWSKNAADLATKLTLGIPVRATAALFVLRFYTRVAFTDVKPPALQAASVLLATKTQEGFKFSMDELILKLTQETRTNKDEILAVESRLLETLDFDLLLFLPIDSTEYFTTEFLRGVTMDKPAMLALSEAIRDTLNQAFVSTAALLYAPSHIALAVLATSVSKVSTKNAELLTQFEKWLNDLFSSQSNSEAIKTAIKKAQTTVQTDSQHLKDQTLYKSAYNKCKVFKGKQRQQQQQRQQGVGVSVKKEP